MSIQSPLGQPLKQRPEAFREDLHKHHMTKTPRRLQTPALEDAHEKGDIQTLAMIASFIEAGATLRWGYHGWEILQGENHVRSEIIDQLCRLEYIQADGNFRAKNVGQQTNELVNHLLSDQYEGKLDDVSRYAFHATQNRAYFEYLDGLMGIYQEHSRLHAGEIAYRSLVGEKFHFWRHFSWLYMAGILHLFGIVENSRLRLARRSLDAITLMIA